MTAIQPLIAVMDDLVEQHQELLKLGYRKKESLISGTIDELAKIVQEEGRIVRSVAKLEDERQKTVELFLCSSGLSLSDVTMTDVIQFVTHSKEKKQLLEIQEKLTQTIQEIQELNQLNQQLLEQSLAFVNHSIQLMTETPEQNMIYKKPNQKRMGQDAQHHPGSSRGFFDAKA
ncbi:flagellar protein FlgN [Microaerobacter geothermalis]|uniref:flagellar protein FlgN n=1 Tax=Microaerobacter geothermalis TaxID=674972 RepID=UPI001F39F9D2|nr:flagellar protein FlgN [Microaerobacter geothermalis]MCF6093413.1 flagellar protein FlgN [Microaerobacter geothermalis]